MCLGRDVGCSGRANFSMLHIFRGLMLASISQRNARLCILLYCLYLFSESGPKPYLTVADALTVFRRSVLISDGAPKHFSLERLFIFVELTVQKHEAI